MGSSGPVLTNPVLRSNSCLAFYCYFLTLASIWGDPIKGVPHFAYLFHFVGLTVVATGNCKSKYGGRISWKRLCTYLDWWVVIERDEEEKLPLTSYSIRQDQHSLQYPAYFFICWPASIQPCYFKVTSWSLSLWEQERWFCQCPIALLKLSLPPVLFPRFCWPPGMNVQGGVGSGSERGKSCFTWCASLTILPLGKCPVYLVKKSLDDTGCNFFACFSVELTILSLCCSGPTVASAAGRGYPPGSCYSCTKKGGRRRENEVPERKGNASESRGQRKSMSNVCGFLNGLIYLKP